MAEKDVNERVREDWVDDTSEGERVRSIISRTYEAQSVSTIAHRAMVADIPVVRMHLDRLAEDGFVERVESEDGVRYRRAPESVVRERVEQIIEDVDADALRRRVAELRETAEEFRRKEELTDEENVEWQTVLRNLYYAEVALEFVEEME